MKKLQELKRHLRPGQVYRREDLGKWSTSVDRHLKQLVESGELTKLAGGLYYRPKTNVFGKAPASSGNLVKAFLKDDRFLLTSLNHYNALSVGTTQLYNETLVYNHKRQGEFKLGGKRFNFVLKPYFPKKATKEFLLVDLVNNLNRLAEDHDRVLSGVKRRALEMDQAALQRAAHKYGAVRTRKFFDALAEGTDQHAA
ncbi:MAG: hypothetical protein KGJ21_05285 [Pseudomonadota bacterium]|nr:hypothetical protein [Pseudomonadota bacterium]